MSVIDCVNNLIQNNDIVVFSKPSCIKCTEVKKELSDLGSSNYVIVDVPSMDDEYAVDSVLVNEELKSLTNSNQYPFCFKDGVFLETNEFKKKLIFFDDGKDF